jgi:oxygen-dependent protoporphyrinogen oxidase
MPDVAVVGGGIAGLTAAYVLHARHDLNVTVFEASDTVGGAIRTEETDGFLVEHGPNSVRSSAPILHRCIDALGLADAVVPANDAARRRYVVRDGAPTALPMSLGAFLTTDLLSWRGKLRLLAEPFAGGGTAGESVASFVRRRLGPEVLDYAVNPFVGGVYAGDPERLSVRHAFRRLFDLEQTHGSLFRGALAALAPRDNGSAEGTPEIPPERQGLFSFADGLQALPDALATALGDRVHTGTPVTALTPTDDGWRLGLGDAPEATSAADTVHADAVVCTVPLHQLTELDLATDVDLTPLYDVPYPPLSVLALGVDADDVGHPLDGFGMLVPEAESDVRILGTIFSSTLFPGRAPDGQVLLTTFIGGMRRPSLGRASTEDLRAIVMEDLCALLDVTGAPTLVRHIRWPRAIPQYHLGYARVQDAIAALEAAHPRLMLAGNYRQGVSVGDAMDSGAEAADRLASTLRAPAP